MRLVVRGGSGWQGLLRAPDIDMVLAVIAFVALLVDPLLLHKITGLTPLMGVLAFVAALPLAARRRFPLGVLAVYCEEPRPWREEEVDALLALAASTSTSSPLRPMICMPTGNPPTSPAGIDAEG